MKYSDGQLALLGDRVLISGKYRGVVVANIDGNEYSREYPKEQWSYLGAGLIIDTDFGGATHYQQDSLVGETIELEHRGQCDF